MLITKMPKLFTNKLKNAKLGEHTLALVECAEDKLNVAGIK
jgi:hypothetical protein